MKRTKTLKSCKKSKELHKNFKTISGSYSGLDASIQAKKQAWKSHATVPLKQRRTDQDLALTHKIITEERFQKAQVLKIVGEIGKATKKYLFTL
jgi:hypothetical protein